jgi:hypothetical protein
LRRPQYAPTKEHIETIVRALESLARARMALRPFAKVAPYFKRLLEDSPDATLYNRFWIRDGKEFADITIGDFRLAAELLSGVGAKAESEEGK